MHETLGRAEHLKVSRRGTLRVIVRGLGRFPNGEFSLWPCVGPVWERTPVRLQKGRQRTVRRLKDAISGRADTTNTLLFTSGSGLLDAALNDPT